MTERKRGSFRQQTEHSLEAAALQVARGIQTPGQSKEQTKLIAQGIAKGIALYKKQQNEKMRELERARKRRLKEKARADDEDGSGATPLVPVSRGTRSALWTAATLLAAVSGIHLWRFAVALPVVLGTWSVPVWLSLPLAAGTGALAVWLYIAGRSPGTRAAPPETG